MISLPTLPNWNGLHPLIVHFPIALLLVAPFFVVLGAVLSPQKGRAFLHSAMIMMVMGTLSLFLATETGEAAGRIAGEAPLTKQVLEQHEELAETTQVLFAGLSVAFAALLFVPGIARRELSRTLGTAMLAAFLILYSTGVLFLGNTAHQGGRLVHELGVKAKITPAVAPAQVSAAGIPTSVSSGHDEFAEVSKGGFYDD